MLLISYSLLVLDFLFTICDKVGVGQLAERMLCSLIGVAGLDSPLPLLGARKLFARRCNNEARKKQVHFRNHFQLQNLS